MNDAVDLADDLVGRLARRGLDLVHPLEDDLALLGAGAEERGELAAPSTRCRDDAANRSKKRGSCGVRRMRHDRSPGGGPGSALQARATARMPGSRVPGSLTRPLRRLALGAPGALPHSLISAEDRGGTRRRRRRVAPRRGFGNRRRHGSGRRVDPEDLVDRLSLKRPSVCEAASTSSETSSISSSSCSSWSEGSCCIRQPYVGKRPRRGLSIRCVGPVPLFDGRVPITSTGSEVGAGPGAPHGAWPLVAADVGTRGCRGPAPTDDPNASPVPMCSPGDPPDGPGPQSSSSTRHRARRPAGPPRWSASRRRCA